MGFLVKRYIKEISRHFSFIKIDAVNILPNHIHVIVLIKGPVSWGAPWRAPTERREFGPLVPKTLSVVINSYKATIVRKIKKAKYFLSEKIWQVNYFERIIRDDSELWAFRWYIRDNPIRHWNKEKKKLSSQIP